MPAWDPKFASRSKLCCFFGQTIPLEGEQKERPSAAAVAAPAAAAALINGKLTFPLLRKRATSARRQRERKLLAEAAAAAAGNQVRLSRAGGGRPRCTCAWQVLQSRAVNLKFTCDVLLPHKWMFNSTLQLLELIIHYQNHFMSDPARRWRDGEKHLSPALLRSRHPLPPSFPRSRPAEMH